MPIDRDRWAEIEPLLDQALDLPPEERAAWLEQLRVDQPTLADAVQELLAHDTGPDTAWPDGGVSSLLGDRPTLAGQTLGKYTLERIVGRGGMGSVWLASRNDGRFEGKVAVKLLNLSLVGLAAEQRFVQEGTLLARLNHPNIGRMLDAGVSEAGQPYLVLEYIEGERIDEYADNRRLDPRQRIALFLDVLKAVAAAHANLIVHRDLKPSNVMVTTDGTVKLLDFGIAKMLDQGRVAGSPVTETANRAFTPEYAAPELMLGQQVSTATDIYSLGVMLYVLLAGRHPVDGQFDTPAALLTAINTEPTRLSDAVTPPGRHPDETTEQAAAARSTTPRRLRRLYLGDLDNVLGQALKRQPAERYQTAAAFAEDLTRFLTNQPVSARPDSWAYRTRKFVRRHRGALTAATLAAVSLLGGLGFALRQMHVAELQRDRAREALKRSAASVSFETLLFRVLDQGGRSFTYQELLDRAREALEREYQGDPISRIQLTIQFAQTYLRRDDPSTAADLLGRARTIADSIGRPEWQGRARCELAAAYARLAGGADSALGLVRTAQTYLEGVTEVERGTENACNSSAGDAWLMLNQPDSAAHRFRAVVDRWVADGDTLDERYLIALNNAARAQFGANLVREARATTIRIVELSRRGFSSDPWTRVAALVNVETANASLGEFVATAALLGPVLRDSTGIDSVASRAPFITSRYARLLLELGRLDSARYWIDRALLREDDLGPIWSVEAHLTAARVAAGQADMARYAVHRDAVERLGRRLNTQGRRELGLLRILTVPDTGEVLAATVREVLESLGFGEGKPQQDLLVDHLLAAARRLNDAGRFREAGSYAAAAAVLATVDSLSTTRSAIVGRALLEQARAEAAAGNGKAARELVERALAPLAAGLGTEHPEVAAARRVMESGTRGADR